MDKKRITSFYKMIGKRLAGILAIALVLAAYGPGIGFLKPRQAKALWYGAWSYDVNPDGKTVTITGYSGENKKVQVISSINGKTVTGIHGYNSGAQAAFDSTITDIILPNTITTIGSSAFTRCTALKSIVIPNSVTEIGDYAFMGCSALPAVDIPASVSKIGYQAFDGCTALSAVTIPAGITETGDRAFANCTGLASVSLPNSMQIISNDMFNGCNALAQVKIPSGVTEIESGAFYGCNALKEVTVPDGVSIVDKDAFRACSALEKIYFMGKSVKLTDRVSDNSVIYCYTNSTALKYAEKWALDYVLLDAPVDIDIADCTITVTSPRTYTGSAIKPTVRVSYLNTNLTRGTHYTLSYKNNVNAGTGTVTITGKGRYIGSTVRTFTISPYNIANCTITHAAGVTYTGGSKTPTVTVKRGTTTLKKNRDYTVSYTGNVNAGVATITVTGKGNYTGITQKTFKINPKNIANCAITVPQGVVYNGEAQTPKVTVKNGTKTLKRGTDYSLKYTNNINPGTATVTVTGKGNFTGSVAKTFKIVSIQKDISEVSLTISGTYVYSGDTQNATLKLKDGSYTLKKNTDYTVKYKNNVNAGNAVVTITGIGNYTGSRVKTYKINPKNLAACTVKAPTQMTYTGKALTPKVTAKNGTTTLVKNTDYTVTYTNNVKVGTGTVTVTGNGNYTGTVAKKFKIVKAASKLRMEDCTVSVPETVEYTGVPATPIVTVKDSGTTLTEGTDYTLSFLDNEEPGKATVLVTGTGKYAGTVMKTFMITPQSSEFEYQIVGNDYVIVTGYTGEYARIGIPQKIAGLPVKEIGARETGDNGFFGCTGVIVPTGVTTIDPSAFFGYDDLTDVTLPKTVSSIGENAFCYSGIREMTVPADVKTIEKNTFCYSELESIKLQSGLTEIDENAFWGCENLENVTLPAGLKSIGTGAFAGCVSLEKITIPSSVTSIGKDAFKNCYDLVVYCYQGSEAEAYCKENNIPYKLLSVNQSLSGCTITIPASCVYTGSEICPAVTVKKGSITLKKGVDYTVAYSKNVNVGTAVVTLAGKGNYNGTVKRNFKILPKATKITKVSSKKKEITVTWATLKAKMKTSRVTGYQFQYSTSKSFATAKTVVAKDYTKDSKTIKNLTSGKTYYVRVRSFMKVGGVHYFSKWSEVKTVKVK